MLENISYFYKINVKKIMAVLTIEIPDKETKFVTEFIKKIGGKVVEKSPYDPGFVAKIRKGDEDIENGKTVKIALLNLSK